MRNPGRLRLYDPGERPRGISRTPDPAIKVGCPQGCPSRRPHLDATTPHCTRKRWRAATRDCALSSILGTPIGIGRPPTASSAVRLGPRLAPRPERPALGDTPRAAEILARGARGRHRPFFNLTPAADYALAGDMLTFPSALRRRTRRTTPFMRATFPSARRAGRSAPCSCCRNGTPTRTATSGCASCSRFGMSALRLSLPYHDRAHAARALARRLHRQRQHRADGAGLPAGGARRAARDRVAARAGLRSIGILGTSLGSCLVDADDGARAADQAPRRSTTSRRTSPTSSGAACRPSTCAQRLDGHIDARPAAPLWMPISPRRPRPCARPQDVCWSTRATI